MAVLQGIWLVLHRQLIQLIRNPVWILVGILDPVLLLLLYAPLLRQALGLGSNGEAYATFVPGLLVMIAALGGLFQGFVMLTELRAGVIERSLVTPIPRVSLLLGRCLRDVVVVLWQAVILTLLALLFGLHIHVVGTLVSYAVVALVVLAISAFSNGLALSVRNDASLTPMLNSLSQPLVLLSGILLPMALAPLWLRDISRWNPLSWAVDAVRAAFAGRIGDDIVWQGLVIMGAAALLGLVYGTRQIPRSVR
ncbi:ABC transporter permease [Winogradskya consettensis]|uniref:Transport permease protein n=1 Tax=Winogradskya consettensis TaxID=113560 RepID=A0A919T2E8_9ACTN|nr:ABC transporter permease [Actinoplanes consettensis]GIM82392.1 transport permease protein [Actinoplanes consettensis]